MGGGDPLLQGEVQSSRFNLQAFRIGENQGVIGKIEVKGTERTLKEVILAEIQVKTGDPYSEQIRQDIERRVMNLRYFISVKVTAEKEGDKYNIIIEVKERATIGVYPIVEFRDGDDKYGLEVSDVNLFGYGKSLGVFYTKTGDDFSTGINYFDRHVMWSNFMLGAGLSVSESEVRWVNSLGQLLSTTEQEVSSMYIQGGYWMNYQWRGFLTISNRDDEYTLKSGSFTPEDGSTDKLSFAIRYYDVTYRLDRLEGPDAFLIYEKGHKAFGGDFAFEKYAIGSRYFYTVATDHTIIGNISFGNGSDLPSHELFAVGGATTIRGYDAGEFQGTKYVLANAEYRIPVLRPTLWNYTGTLTWLAFLDSGFAWPRGSSMRLSDLATGAGSGLRLYVDQFQAGTAGLDVAYGFETRDWRIHLSFGTVF